MTYYKVVRKGGLRDPKEFESYVANWDRAKVTYRVGEFVETREAFANVGLHLLVFKSKKSAFKYVNVKTLTHSGSIKLFKCHVRGVVKLPKRRLAMPEDIFVAGASASGYIIQAKTSKEVKEALLASVYRWPTGSAMVKKVKLVEEVRV